MLLYTHFIKAAWAVSVNETVVKLQSNLALQNQNQSHG